MPITTATPIYIQDCGFHSAMGSTDSHIHQCLSGDVPSNMVANGHILVGNRQTIVGQIADALPNIPAHLDRFDTRNNRLALSALHQIEEQILKATKAYGTDRVAVIIGTSTSGIADGEAACEYKLQHHSYPDTYHYNQQELGNVSQFIAEYFNITGPCYSISTACSSSGRVFITAKRLLQSGLVDAVIVGGVDTLCRLTLNGFDGLEALSSSICTPFGSNRDGINIGEASALMLLSRELSDIALLGVGDSSDAHHISAPHPEGDGAERAMRKALDDANLTVKDIGYINAHGTGTKLNDTMESKAIYRLFKDSVPVSSTKPLTGHTLGAASATEVAIAWHILKYNLALPEQHNKDTAEDIMISLVNNPQQLKSKIILSNSFAFGGNNTSIILGRTDD
ncbi:beta-ketoacyl-[acyl-carrier-protein] synthase II [Vibrio breoganii]|uniref:Beta-ketoacyl-[acyl-carrier-protein] synthase II n=1 Tax=Vibrio breoganii TaxID=553239 RepID=A0AAP8MYN8_9VIBR|nr:beta-ketoacyl-[acyl-carrier-protein] synthase family protein [Vibrio breoganii]OED84841.1 beta-ketoacyl-[acyl-carrier-protein] synthase II [Vibrio breoganii ZF-55]PMP14049.1 beta-ketoacyl-[acyl-carrier-protein] synthase II [Vibrio breoganii]